MEKKESKESKLIELLSGTKSYTRKEVIKQTGYSEASVDMYLSQGYLDRKNKPFKVVESLIAGCKAFRYEPKKVDNNWHAPKKAKKAKKA